MPLSGKERGVSRILESVEQFLDGDDWKYQRVDGRSALRFGVSGEHGKLDCLAIADDSRDLLRFYSILPVMAPEPQRHLIAELVTRINYSLLVGNFELDMSDGEIRYKTTADFENVDVSLSVVKNVIYWNISTADRYLPAVMKVLYANLSPETALEEPPAKAD